MPGDGGSMSNGSRLVRTMMALAIAGGALRLVVRADSDVPMAKPEAVGISSKRLQRIHALIQGYRERTEIAGAVTLGARHAKVVHFEAQGYRYKEDKADMRKDTIFSLQSMTKPIVSTALMMLWEEARFLLDDPIANWLPSYANKQVMENGKLVKANPVTIRHILTHTSGLTLSAAPAAPVENALATPEERDAALRQQQQRQREAAAARPKTLAEAIERAAPLPLNFQPGTKWEYGSPTDSVAVLVKKMAGMTIDQYLRERIFQPLGMRDTFYNIPREKVARV